MSAMAPVAQRGGVRLARSLRHGYLGTAHCIPVSCNSRERWLSRSKYVGVIIRPDLLGSSVYKIFEGVTSRRLNTELLTSRALDIKDYPPIQLSLAVILVTDTYTGCVKKMVRRKNLRPRPVRISSLGLG